MFIVMKAEEQKRISQHTRQKYMFLRIGAGIGAMMRKKWKIIPLVVYVLLMLQVWNKRFTISPIDSTAPLWTLYQTAINIFVVLITIIGMTGILALIGMPLRAEKLQENLLRAGFVNHAGECTMKW